MSHSPTGRPPATRTKSLLLPSTRTKSLPSTSAKTPKSLPSTSAKTPKSLPSTSAKAPKLWRDDRKTVFLIACGDNLCDDRPDWFDKCFGNDGVYRFKDLNFPKALPKRDAGYHQYGEDPPLTEMSYMEAKLIGNYLERLDGGGQKEFFSSAELASIQAAASFAKGLTGEARPINVDSCMFDIAAKYTDQEPFVSLNDLKRQPCVVDQDYFMKSKQRLKTRQINFAGNKEDLQKFILRNSLAFKEAMKCSKIEKGAVFVFAPRYCIDIYARALQNLPPRSELDLKFVMDMITPWAILVFEQNPTNKAYKLIKHTGASLSFTRAANPSFDWTIYDWKR